MSRPSTARPRCKSCENSYDRRDDGTCGNCGWPFDTKAAVLAEPGQPGGLRALVISPAGTMRVKRLPGIPAQAAALVADLIGGNGTVIGGGPPAGDEISPSWVAHYDEEARLHGQPPNARASALVRRLGWTTVQADDHLLGTVVFLGRRVALEVDVPGYVLGLADLTNQPEST